jgi:indolepyruvate ferredoxin oxidoreductase
VVAQPSHVLIGESQEHAIRTTWSYMAAADLIIGRDPIVVAGRNGDACMRAGRTSRGAQLHAIHSGVCDQCQLRTPADARVS